jgi:hypothetical protein
MVNSSHSTASASKKGRRYATAAHRTAQSLPAN